MATESKIQERLSELDAYRIFLQKKNKKQQLWYFLVPGLVLIWSAIFSGNLAGLIFPALITAILSYMFYYLSIGSPFSDLKTDLRKSLLTEFFKTYHPDISFSYFPDRQSVRPILRRARLISPDIYKEEDVIIGKHQSVDFYISEINLKRRSKNHSYSIFKGILFKIKIPGRSFPSARIQSKAGLLTRFFKGFEKNEAYGFWHESDNPLKFDQELKSLFPFIKFLAQRQGDVRIATQGEEITIMMESDMKFLDNPKPGLNRSFLTPQYYENISRQLNSLLFIIDAFVDDLNIDDIEERLELKAIEYIKQSNEKPMEGSPPEE